MAGWCNRAEKRASHDMTITIGDSSENVADRIATPSYGGRPITGGARIAEVIEKAS